jgi:DNA-binding NtrC family response regulator
VNAGFFVRVAEFQRRIIRAALRRSKGNQRVAAEELGIHRNTLAAYCDKLGVDSSVFYRRRSGRRIRSSRPKYYFRKEAA